MTTCLPEGGVGGRWRRAPVRSSLGQVSVWSAPTGEGAKIQGARDKDKTQEL